jgi:hypothetical protein
MGYLAALGEARGEFAGACIPSRIMQPAADFRSRLRIRVVCGLGVVGNVLLVVVFLFQH